MNAIALVTASFGGIDHLKLLPDHAGIDAFYYCDEATLEKADTAAVASWTRVQVCDYPRQDFDNRLRAKYFKLQIHRLDEVRHHRWLAWGDGSLLFHETGFIRSQVERLEGLPARQRILLVPHPQRKTILEEYQFIRTEMERGNEYLRSRYAKENLAGQIEWYRRQGWNLNARLYCGGFWIIENSELFQRCWNDWWDQNLRFGIMDQLSLSPVLEQHGVQPQSLEVPIWHNEHFTLRAARFVG